MSRATMIVLIAVISLFAPSGLAKDPELRGITRANRLCEKGDRALREGDFDKAREHFTEAVGYSPAFPPAHIGLGSLAMAEGDYEGALEAYELARDGYAKLGAKILEIENRRYADAKKNIGMLNDTLRQAEQGAGPGLTQIHVAAIRNQIERLKAVSPPDDSSIGEAPGEIFFYIGNALFRLGRNEEALRAWETCAERSPDFPLVYNNLALVQMKLGDLEAARANLARAEELGFPVNPQFKEDLQMDP